MATIHPTAIIDSSAQLGHDVDVGPYSIVEAGAVVGDRTRIMASVLVAGCSTVGSDCELHHGAVVGGAPQMRTMDGPGGRVRIGNGTVIREYVTVHRAVAADAWTLVGERCYLLATSHVAHDCVLGDEVTLANGALLAGFVSVGDRTFVSGHTGVHQFVRIGRVVMVGALAAVSKDVPPFTMVAHDGLVEGLNVVGMRRAGLTSEERLSIKRAYHTLYHEKLNVSQAIEALLSQLPSPFVEEIVAFIRASKRGLCAARHKNHHHGDADQWDHGQEGRGSQ